MRINFTKMQGCGNDYVYIDGGKELVPQDKKSELAKRYPTGTLASALTD